MLPPLAEIRHVAGQTARRSAFMVAGGALVLTGAGFSVAALWIVLAEVFDALAATLILSGILLGLGLVVMGLAPRKPKLTSADQRLRHKARTGTLYQPDGSLPPVAEAFLFGLAVAMQIRNRRR